jgi:KWG Leptospira.
MKKIMLPLMLVLLLTGWNSAISGIGERGRMLAKHMEKAEEYESKKIYIDALTEFELALEYTEEPFPIQMKILNIYLNLNKRSDFVRYAEVLIKEYNYSEETVMKLVEYYKDRGDRRSAIEVLKIAAQNREDIIIYKQEIDNMRGTHSERYIGKDEIVFFHNESAIFQDKDKFGLLKADGDEYIAPIYEVIKPFGDEPKLATVFADDEWFCIDTSGYRKLVPDNTVEELGIFGENLISFKAGGFYGYMNHELEIVHEPQWEEAGIFTNGTAAVKKDGKWGLIDKEFNDITEYIYDDICMTKAGVATLQGVFFGSKAGKYSLYNLSGDKIGNNEFDDVRVFKSELLAAVCINGEWGFINKNGEMVIEPQYEDADSFTKELAPVKIDEQWGYIDIHNVVKILPAYNEVTTFTDIGTAFVKRYNRWNLIRLIE